MGGQLNMAANYGYNTGMPVSYQPNAFFLQPHGNVYLIGSSLEVANVPNRQLEYGNERKD